MCEGKIDHPSGPLQRLSVCASCDKDHHGTDTQNRDKAFLDRIILYLIYAFPPVFFSPPNTGISLLILFWEIWLLLISFLQHYIGAKSALKKKKKTQKPSVRVA